MNNINEVYNCILKRRSIRNYSDRKVEKETLMMLLNAAAAAPSACNYLPWEFVVIDEAEVLNELRANLFFGKYNAPAAIVVCGNMEIAIAGPGRDYWIQDCSAAIENILLTATSLGLGSVWIGLHPLPSNIRPVRKVLNIPEEVVPLAVVYLGYPDEEKEPRTQLDEKRVYWQRYEPRKHRTRKKNTKYE